VVESCPGAIMNVNVYDIDRKIRNMPSKIMFIFIQRKEIFVKTAISIE